MNRRPFLLRALPSSLFAQASRRKAYSAKIFPPSPPGSGCATSPAARDGTVWFAASATARWPARSARRQVDVSLGQGAAPHGVIVGPDGAAWVTEGGQNAIARVDPETTRCSSS